MRQREEKRDRRAFGPFADRRGADDGEADQRVHVEPEVADRGASARGHIGHSPANADSP